ncbi:hypothetical protein Hokovirus_1_345 [Hokovirus HKV1]|uniref:DUF7448 domain-containing protein n=1 Tax=Hokovirus HKV1 TaxID=1977638 RepID=A0A1V0SFG4_9VIRU|nr:hypothetical protein Hokovirus_1_345 [Hokovirus HKV1]
MFSNSEYTIESYNFKCLDYYPEQEYENSTTELRIKCTNGKKIVLKVVTSFCSYGWLEFDDLEPYFNKTITDIKETYEVGMVASELSEYDRNIAVVITFSDNTEFEMVHRNSSNGYYSNGFDVRII